MQWYEGDVQNAIASRISCPYEPKTIFYGSSSIRLWDGLYEDFKDYKPVNLGFGGSTLAACVFFFERIVWPVPNPDTFILYAGDNDLGDGKSADDVLFFFREFMVKLRKRYPAVPFYYISIKPSLSRLGLIRQIKKANELIKSDLAARGENNGFVDIYRKMTDPAGIPAASLFDADGLHLSPKGYAVWKEAVLQECFANR